MSLTNSQNMAAVYSGFCVLRHRILLLFSSLPKVQPFSELAPRQLARSNGNLFRGIKRGPKIRTRRTYIILITTNFCGGLNERFITIQLMHSSRRQQ